ncbi:unnamed protein product [Adineta steineri]|uniref:Uncharacterized protein n=1 Tax=Adineta steineri TaxID=433720 RepID=A0A815ALD8_9BILA|nr:unnamed protein product [Adineta steineri]CAF1546713.1 unnamed protein product [Adineta steineri]
MNTSPPSQPNLTIYILNFTTAEIHESDGKILLNRSISSLDSNGHYRLPNYEFLCIQQLSKCSKHDWSLIFQLELNPINIFERERKYLLFSGGAHEPHSDGILIYLYQSKNTSYLDIDFKEFHNDQIAFYWQIEADLEINKSIDVVITIENHATSIGQHHQMTIFFDGYLYKQTEVEKYTELYVFKYEKLHSTSITIYGNDSGVARFDNMIYYERILTDEEIANESIPINCTLDFGDGYRQTNGTDRHQYYTANFSRDYTR